MPFGTTSRFEQAVPFGLQEYLELVDTMGCAVHLAKRGAIPANTPPILTRLGMNAEAFNASSAQCGVLRRRNYTNSTPVSANPTRLIMVVLSGVSAAKTPRAPWV
jgi:hypothetical protein